MKTNQVSDMRALTVADLSAWGLDDVAYVKRTVVNDQEGWSIHAADGRHIGYAPDRELAFAAVRQHELEPFSVH